MLAFHSIVMTIFVGGPGKAHIYNSFDAFCICFLLIVSTFSSSIHLFHNRRHNCHNHHLYPKACLQLQLLNFQAVSCLRLSLCLTALFELSLSGLEIEGETISKEIFSESPIFQGHSPINGIWIKSSGFDPNDGFNHVIKSG